MKLHQLRYLNAIVQQDLNISQAADALHTSQSGVSKQIQLLESELGMVIFLRNGKRLTGVTESGKEVIALAQRVLRDMSNIKRVGDDFRQQESGTLTIATTHTQARYRLPAVVTAFMQQYPHVKLHVHQGNPSQVAQQVESGEADIGIATEVLNQSDKLRCLPCYQWNRCIIAPEGHALFTDLPLTLAKIIRYPLITYDFSVTGGSLVNRVFQENDLIPNIVLTAMDADVIKTYVNLGLGIGLVANIAYDDERDKPLLAADVSHLFPNSTTYLAVHKESFLRQYVYAFMQLLTPHYSLADIKQLLQS